jgi:hypothetical protein
MDLLIIAVVQLSLPTSAAAPSLLNPTYTHITIPATCVRSTARVLQAQFLLFVVTTTPLIVDARIPCFIRV